MLRADTCLFGDVLTISLSNLDGDQILRANNIQDALFRVLSRMSRSPWEWDTTDKAVMVLSRRDSNEEDLGVANYVLSGFIVK